MDELSDENLGRIHFAAACSANGSVLPANRALANYVLEHCRSIALAIDSGRGNEREIAAAIDRLKR